MAYDERGVAYDLSLFEEEEVSFEQEAKSQGNIVYDLNEERKKRIKPRVKPLTAFLCTFVSTLVILAMAAIIHGQARLTELNQQINSAETTLSELKSDYTQLEMKVDNKLSPSVVEEYAKNTLGMAKTESYQKEFISLSEGDRAVVVHENEKSFFDKLADAISDIWSE